MQSIVPPGVNLCVLGTCVQRTCSVVKLDMKIWFESDDSQDAPAVSQPSTIMMNIR